MEKRIELERRGRPAEEIIELNLDNCRAVQQISGLTDEFVKLEVLSLINVGLTTLKGFPSLPNLKKLELSDNRISGGLNLLHGCPNLSYINLSGNKIKDIETLQPLKDLPELQNLDLFNCEVTNAENYREAIFEMLANLVYLDGFDRQNQEVDDEDDDEGEGDDSSEDNDDREGDILADGEFDESGVLDDDDEEDEDEDDDEDDDDDDDEDDVDGEGESDEEFGENGADDVVRQGTKRKHTDVNDEGDEEEEDGDE